MNTKQRKQSTVDHTQARRLSVEAGTRFREWVKGEEPLTVLCVDAVGESLATGLIHDGEGQAPEGTYSRAAYAREFFGLANGSLITFWSTLAVARRKGVRTDSDLWNVLAYGPKVARKGGMAEAIAKAKGAAGVASAVRKVAGFDPKTGEKIKGARARNVAGDGGTDGAPTDSLTACTEAVKVLRKHLPKIEAGASDPYMRIRKALNDLVVSQDKARKTGRFAPKAETKTTAKAAKVAA